MFAGFTNVKDEYFTDSILYLWQWWEFVLVYLCICGVVFVYLYLYLCICGVSGEAIWELSEVLLLSEQFRDILVICCKYGWNIQTRLSNKIIIKQFLGFFLSRDFLSLYNYKKLTGFHKCWTKNLDKYMLTQI